MQKIDSEDLASIAAALDDLPPRRTLTPYEVIAALEQHLERAQGRGYDLDALLVVLRKRGITLSRSTARSYLRRARRTARAANDALSAALPAARPTPKAAPSPVPAPALPAGQSVVELARSRARERAATSQTDDELPTAGSFRIRPDKVEL